MRGVRGKGHSGTCRDHEVADGLRGRSEDLPQGGDGRGVENRGTFMSVLHTLKACGVDPAERIERALDAYAIGCDTDMFDALYGGLDLKIPVLPRGQIRKLPKAITGK